MQERFTDRWKNTRCFKFEKPSVGGVYDVMPDGQRFVMIDDSEAAPPPTQLVLVQNWHEELRRLVPTDK